ncbi:hypothetical protein PG985_012805 [Apiospora marii]|uniref:uncharacterized protein n=1 Tax=Apiospora marii TaxID=335849 RepID=UPI00312D91B9
MYPVSRNYRHIWDLPLCWVDGYYFQVTFANALLKAFALYCSKTSILLMFLQVFSAQRHVRILIYAGMLATFLIYFPSIPLAAIFSAPRAGHDWGELLENGFTEKMTYWVIAQSALTTVLDIYILVLPLPILKKLHLPLGKRLQLVAVFATAIL